MIPITFEDGVCGICRDWLPEEPDYVYHSKEGDLDLPGCCVQLKCCNQNVHGACVVKELVRLCPNWGQGHGCVNMGCPFCAERLDQDLVCEAVCTDLLHKISLMSGGQLQAFKMGEMECAPWAEIGKDIGTNEIGYGKGKPTMNAVDDEWPLFGVEPERVAQNVRHDSQLEAAMFDMEFQPEWEYYGNLR